MSRESGSWVISHSGNMPPKSETRLTRGDAAGLLLSDEVIGESVETDFLQQVVKPRIGCESLTINGCDFERSQERISLQVRLFKTLKGSILIVKPHVNHSPIIG